jgi:hypothetical protein
MVVRVVLVVGEATEEGVLATGDTSFGQRKETKGVAAEVKRVAAEVRVLSAAEP